MIIDGIGIERLYQREL